MDFKRHFPTCEQAAREFTSTIYTSNIPIDRLKCDDRITSRIYEDSIPVMMPEISIRKKKADKSRQEFLDQVMNRRKSND